MKSRYQIGCYATEQEAENAWSDMQPRMPEAKFKIIRRVVTTLDCVALWAEYALYATEDNGI